MTAKVVRVSWYWNDPDEDTAKHYQEVCEENWVEYTKYKLRKFALYADGIVIPPREITVRDWP